MAKGWAAAAVDVALACRILHAEGHEHSFLGHVSARASDAGAMYIKPSGLGLGEVSADDVLEVDFDGQVLRGQRPVHAELPIHTSIYASRDDVNAVVHTHALLAAALAASDANFEIVNQDSVHFVDGVGAFDSPLLVTTQEQGDLLAQALGARRAVLLRNHGLVTVGESVKEAVFLAVTFVNSLKVQLTAMQFGGLLPMERRDALQVNERFSAGYADRVAQSWAYLCRRAETEESER